MTQLHFLITCLVATCAVAQQPVAPPAPAPPDEEVLQALPIGGDDDVGVVVPPQRAAAAATAKPAAKPLAQSQPVTAVTKPPVKVPAKPAPAESEPLLQAEAADSEEPDTPITPEAPKVPDNVKPTGEDALRLQIFLDDACFGPGVIDGRPGRFTELAVRSWNEVNGHPLDDWTAVMAAARKAVPHPLAVAVVPDVVAKWVNPALPTKYSSQAKSKLMSYRSNAEFMAERYHCDVPYLIELNSAKKINNLLPRQSLVVPNVCAFQVEKVTGAGYQTEENMSQRHAVVDTRINQVRIFEAAPAALVVAEPGEDDMAAPPPVPNRGLIASFPITPGENRFIKFGTWEVRNAVELPVWRYDQKLLDTGKRSSDSESLNIPPGPNSPVGIFWAGLTKPGIGLHGTPNPETIGRARSHGCIRLANWDAIRLPTLIRPGTTVEIR